MSSPEDITMEEYESLVIPELEAARCDPTYRRWGDHDLAILRRYYSQPDIPIAKIAEYLNRTRDSVVVKAARLGIRRE